MNTKFYFLCAVAMLHIIFSSTNMLQAQNTNLPVGAIPGAIDVSHTGAATYTIPIEVVPGIKGLQPNLSIVYNSQGGMGLLGMKWDIAGLSAISRCGKIPYFEFYSNSNEPVEVINFPPENQPGGPFTMDGERLISLGGYSYGKEVEDFTRIYIENHNSASNMCFVAYTDDGSVMEYGRTFHSKQKMGDTENVLSWRLNKIMDAEGNTMVFTYDTHNGETILNYITYAFGDLIALQDTVNPYGYDWQIDTAEVFIPDKERGGGEQYAVVAFNYCRPNDLGDLGKNTLFVQGYGMPQTKFLENITVAYNGEVFRKYEFTYNKDTANQHTLHLEKITLYGEDGTEKPSLNSTVIEWPVQAYSNGGHSFIQHDNNENIITGDFNGDGYSDYVVYDIPNGGKCRWKVWVYNPKIGKYEEGYAGDQHTCSEDGKMCFFYAADIFNEGRDNLIIAEKNPNNTTALVQIYQIHPILQKESEFEVENFSQLLFGDFDGDEKIDIVAVRRDKLDNYKCSFGYYTNGEYHPNNIDNFPACSCKVNTIDHVGNGKKKLELIFPYPSDTHNGIYHLNKGGTKFSKMGGIDLKDANYNQDRYFGDFNGDGISDLLIYEKDTTAKLYFGKGDGQYIGETVIVLYQPDYNPVFIVDMNGDGKDDILQLGEHGGTSIKYSKGCVNGAYKYEICFLESFPSLNNFGPHRINFGDYDHDGNIDIFCS